MPVEKSSKTPHLINRLGSENTTLLGSHEGTVSLQHLTRCITRAARLTVIPSRLTNTHIMRWHAHHGTGGTGHLCEGRFKCFPVQEDEHLDTELPYVERNPVRTSSVEKVEAWRWGSA